MKVERRVAVRLRLALVGDGNRRRGPYASPQCITTKRRYSPICPVGSRRGTM